MKEATGELNMTVVTIVAIAGVAAFLTIFLWPSVRNKVTNQWDDINGRTLNTKGN